ncbi:hypothetical protein glysoja_047952 [Glycine soja]|uniref:B3 domain-containing protein n=1 Tax=Glycine soja TaxID=3848 RepID=A0A0B2P1A1_GLYSO|nr:hypothetical protein glysoja_047952 [Glycine soja]
MSLVTPMAKFDPELVLEFYANAWSTEEGVRDMRSWVKGQWIPFDADALNQFLGEPLVLQEGQQCEFSQRRNRADGFDEEAIAQLLCTPGQDFARTAAGRRVRIMRTSMTTLTQTWMTLLLSNVLPSDHNSDLPLPMVYAILTRMSVHVAQVIADTIYLFVGMPPTRHPLDPDKSNRALVFLALITGLCQLFGVPVTPTKVIRPPITRAFIEKYCTPRQAQGDAPQAVDAPPPPHQVDPAGSLGMERYLQHLVRQQAQHLGPSNLHVPRIVHRFDASFRVEQELRRTHGIHESVLMRFVGRNKNTTFSVDVVGPLHQRAAPTIRHHVFTIDVSEDMIQQNYQLVLPPEASIYLTASKKYMVVDRGSGRHQKWMISMNNGLSCVADVWIHYLGDCHLKAGDEVIFFYNIDQHLWEVLYRKQVKWDDTEDEADSP